MQRTMVIEYPQALPAVSNQSPEAFEQEARKAMAVKLYDMGRLSSGRAAQSAGSARVECEAVHLPQARRQEKQRRSPGSPAVRRASRASPVSRALKDEDTRTGAP